MAGPDLFLVLHLTSEGGKESHPVVVLMPRFSINREKREKLSRKKEKESSGSCGLLSFFFSPIFSFDQSVLSASKGKEEGRKFLFSLFHPRLR